MKIWISKEVYGEISLVDPETGLDYTEDFLATISELPLPDAEGRHWMTVEEYTNLKDWVERYESAENYLADVKQTLDDEQKEDLHKELSYLTLDEYMPERMYSIAEAFASKI